MTFTSFSPLLFGLGIISLLEPSIAHARSGDGSGGILIGIGLALFIAFSIGHEKGHKKLRDSTFNKLKSELDQQNRTTKNDFDEKLRSLKTTQEEISRQNSILNERDKAFKEGTLKGRKWLANLLAETEVFRSKQIANSLESKKNPAYKAAEATREVGQQARHWKEKAKFLEYQLLSYKEAYPFLEEFEELILEDELAIEVDLNGEVSNNESHDKTRFFLSKEEYEKLPENEKHQLALTRYLQRPLNNAQIGRLYERQIGFSLETSGYEVNYHGAIEGFEDLGRDLIAVKGKNVEIVQAKCWSKSKVIREKHIFQLFASATHYRLSNPDCGKVKAVFYSTTEYSDVAIEIAKILKVDLKKVDMDKNYPMIKCNISRDGEKIYHLPFDQQYDRIKIEPEKGEFYAETVQQAAKKGFRRAKRYLGT